MFDTTSGYQPPVIDSSFYGRDFIEIEQLVNPEVVYQLFSLAQEIELADEERELADFQVEKKTAALIFFQASTRTYTSFHTACRKLGLDLFAEHGMGAFSSTQKGEDLSDTIHSVYNGNLMKENDVIIMRHPLDDASRIAAESTDALVVNAGSGSLRHPTQALLDLYTVWKEIKSLEGLEFTFMGDLKFGRTVKSLGKILALMGKDLKFNLVSPPRLLMTENIKMKWAEAGIQIQELEDVRDVIRTTDVLYITRLQEEWYAANGMMEEYNSIAADYEVNPETIEGAHDNMLIMHPLPRKKELSKKLDNDPRSVYLRAQMRNGTYIRTALLRSMLYPEA